MEDQDYRTCLNSTGVEVYHRLSHHHERHFVMAA